MKRLLFIFILLVSCQSKVEERGFLFSDVGNQTDIWTDTVNYNDDYTGGMRYRGTWIDADYGKISDKNTEGSELFYRAWMGGFDLYTFVDGHHGGYWINIDGNRTYVNLTENERAIKETFSVDDLAYGNHNITITPIADSTFIFVKLVKFVAYSPFDPRLSDTIPPVEPPITPPDTVITDTIMVRLLDMEYQIIRQGRFQIFIGDSLDVGEHNEYEKAIEHALKSKALNPTKNVTIKSPIRRVELE